MIYTITCNPALDCTVHTNAVQWGTINPIEGCTLTPGGKGVNVSRILKELEMDNVALGFAAGENGALLEGALQKMGITTQFVPLREGQTRINVKIYGDTETQFNAPGAAVSPDDMMELTALLAPLNPTGEDAVCLCGSLAPEMPPNTYRRLVKQLHKMGVVHTVVDTSGEALMEALAEKPWLIKPNREELEALVGRELPDQARVVSAAETMMDLGAQNVLVSMGGDGAVLCTADGQRLYLPTPSGKVIGTVGAGDSLVAGFVTGWLRYRDVVRALQLGVACGSATAFSEGLATAKDIAAAQMILPVVQGI